jgi:hypothetical protein
MATVVAFPKVTAARLVKTQAHIAPGDRMGGLLPCEAAAVHDRNAQIADIQFGRSVTGSVALTVGASSARVPVRLDMVGWTNCSQQTLYPREACVGPAGSERRSTGPICMGGSRALPAGAQNRRWVEESPRLMRAVSPIAPKPQGRQPPHGRARAGVRANRSVDPYRYRRRAL